MTDQPIQSLNELKLYRCSLLPDFSQPFVFITARHRTSNGDTLFELQFFIVDEHRPLDARGFATDAYYLKDRNSQPILPDFLFKFALDQAKEVLENIVVEQVQGATRPPAFFQPVTLQEIQEEEVMITAQRERWTGKWRPMLDFSNSSRLRTLVENIERSPIKDLNFRLLTPQRRR